MLRSLPVFAVLFVVLVAIACSGGDGDSSNSSSDGAGTPATTGGSEASPTSDNANGQETPAASSGGSGGGVGVVEANGQTFTVSEVRRCDPFFDGEDDLDLQALASDGVILFVVINTLGSAGQLVSHELSIQGGALGSGGQVGAFSGVGNSTLGGPWIYDDEVTELPGPPFVVDGDRISGSLMVTDARGGPETLDVTSTCRSRRK